MLTVKQAATSPTYTDDKSASKRLAVSFAFSAYFVEVTRLFDDRCRKGKREYVINTTDSCIVALL
jgi:hypothetical protein